MHIPSLYNSFLKTLLVITIVLLHIGEARCQSNEIDSLKRSLHNPSSQLQQALTNLKLAKLHERIDLQKGKAYAHKALYQENDSLMAEACNQLGRFCFFMADLDSAAYFFEHAKQHLLNMNDSNRVAILNIGIGAIQLKQGHYTKTIKTLTESVSYFEQTRDEMNAAKCYSNMSAAFAELNNINKAIEYNEKALKIFSKKELPQFQLITLPNLAAQHLKNGDTLKAINYNLEAENIAKKAGNKRSLSIIYNNLGSAYLDSDEPKAKEYLEKTIQIKNEINLKDGIEVALGNLGYLYLKNRDFKTALSYYKQVEEQTNGKQLVYCYEQIQKCYVGLRLYDQALHYAQQSRILNDSILSAENQKIFSEIQTKYETEKKEKEILALETRNLEVDKKRTRTLILLGITLIALALTFLMVILLLKNAKRKRVKIQNKLKAKTEELVHQLKTQELSGMDAIIDAQEKERSRIANDLHDNLGSRIATLNLYINDLDNKAETDEKELLLEKLKLLAEETYAEVRKIAHKQNASALLSKGLIPSMNAIAYQISNSGQLNVSIININVTRRVHNKIELQVFRIIQELLTNIIKHAEANEVNIQFSEDEDRLNVMVEDNGKGFDIHSTPFGFGLNNIEKRTESIGGELIIDSSPGNGTTIILNIPL